MFLLHTHVGEYFCQVCAISDISDMHAAAGCQRSYVSWMLFLPLSSGFQLPCAEPGVLISNALKENMNNLQFMIKY